jgi:hypothetical protein
MIILYDESLILTNGKNIGSSAFAKPVFTGSTHPPAPSPQWLSITHKWRGAGKSGKLEKNKRTLIASLKKT